MRKITRKISHLSPTVTANPPGDHVIIPGDHVIIPGDHMILQGA